MTPDELARLARVKLPEDWKFALKDALLSPDMDKLRDFLRDEMKNHTVYPPANLMFAAFHYTALCDVKVVILGQDPYHGKNQAMGLAFSVPKSTPAPPSLVNILKELALDIGVRAQHGDLSAWARQGVLLLNSVLSVREGMAGSHQNQGWEQFSDAVISAVNERTEHTVFILWGKYAQHKGRFIDTSRHLLLTAVHPSPLAANRGGFFGTHPFSKANHYLARHGRTPIDWQI